MLEARINILKRKLDRMVGAGCSFEDVYDLSIKLDKLIVRYYMEKKGSTDRLT